MGKTSPGTKVFGRFELAHISPDFRNHTNGSHGIGDTGDGKQQFSARVLRFSELKDELLQRITKVVEIGNVLADDLELFRLPGREGTIYSLLNFLRGSLAAPVKERRDIKGFTRMLQQLTDNGGRALAEHVTEHVIQFEVGDRETVLGTVLLSRGIPDELLIVAAQVTQLTNILRRDKAAANQVVLEKVGDPHGIFLMKVRGRVRHLLAREQSGHLHRTAWKVVYIPTEHCASSHRIPNPGSHSSTLSDRA